MKYKTAYISGPLTNVDPSLGLRAVYEELGAFLGTLGIEACVPHLKGDPITFPNLTAQEIYEMDAAAVRAADITIAYVGIPSLGVGQELEIAREAGKGILLWWFTGEKVSRMTRGNPAVTYQFEVKDVAELYAQLKMVLV